MCEKNLDSPLGTLKYIKKFSERLINEDKSLRPGREYGEYIRRIQVVLDKYFYNSDVLYALYNYNKNSFTKNTSEPGIDIDVKPLLPEKNPSAPPVFNGLLKLKALKSKVVVFVKVILLIIADVSTKFAGINPPIPGNKIESTVQLPNIALT